MYITIKNEELYNKECEDVIIISSNVVETDLVNKDSILEIEFNRILRINTLLKTAITNDPLLEVIGNIKNIHYCKFLTTDPNWNTTKYYHHSTEWLKYPLKIVEQGKGFIKSDLITVLSGISY